MGTIFKHKRIIRLEDVDSTNNYMSSKFQGRTLPQGSVVWAENQNKGRGQGENKWHSESGKNLTFSMILYPEFILASNQFYISKAIALAVADFAVLYTDKVSIKWPNDIYVKNNKIAGLLIENSIERTFIKTSIIGIGININQKSFPKNIPNPTSLAIETKNSFDREELLLTLIDLIEYRYSMLKDGDFQTIDENYLEILFQYKKMALYEARGKRFAGSIERIEPTGELIIRTDKGETLRFGYKEVEYVLS